jgi:hypothetical protein
MFCPNCRRFIRQMRLMQATLKIMPEEPVKDVDALAQRLADERLKDRKGGEAARVGESNG